MQFHNSTFENDIVDLDGNVYDHCDFKHCILDYWGGPPPRFAQSRSSPLQHLGDLLVRSLE